MQVVQSQDSLYYSEQLELNGQFATIRGTLLAPESDHQVALVLFISGSGPTDRDGNQANMKNDCFKLLAQDLAAHEIASFRFDKMGIGASIPLDLNTEDLRIHHFVNDIKGWIQMLAEDSRFSHIIVAGHSLGSLMGILASQESPADAFISIAGPGKALHELIYDQLNAQSPFLATGARNVIDSLAAGYLVQEVHPFLVNLFNHAIQPYLISVFKHDPTEEIKKLNMPVLIIQGDHDLQVSVSDAENLHGAHHDSELAIISQMNHVLKEAPLDRNENILFYNDPSAPVSPELVERVVKFILKIKS